MLIFLFPELLDNRNNFLLGVLYCKYKAYKNIVENVPKPSLKSKSLSILGYFLTRMPEHLKSNMKFSFNGVVFTDFCREI